MNNTFFVREFNLRKRDEIWNKDELSMKESFRFKLNLLKMLDKQTDFKVPSKYFDGEFYRLALGYRGVGKNSGFTSGIQSEASINLLSNQTTNDHVVGTTEVGRYIHYVFRNSNYNIDWMINDWLYDHLFLWATVKITKEEHHKNSVLRNSEHTLKQKLNFDHYIKVSKLI